MAKEFKMKLQIDTGGAVKELEGTIDTISGFDKQLSALQDKLNNTKIGTEEYKKLQKEYDRTAKAAENVKNANKGWLDTIASAPGLVGTLGQSLQGVGKAFGNFNMLLKTSLVGFIAAAVVELVNQFKKMEGVMDPLNKVASIFSGVMSKLANTVLPLVVAPLEAVAFLLEKTSNLFGGAGDSLADLADRQDALSDSTAEYELQQSKANRALAEAREKAQDSTLSIQDRKKAVQEAGRLEKQIAEEGKARALEQARIIAGQLATTLGFNKERLDAIKKYDAAQLESFTKEIAQRKGLNQEQRTALLQQIAQINEISAQSAKIQKKTNKELEGLDNEDKQRREQANKDALERQKNKLNAEIELEKNKNNTNEASLRKLLEQKDKLENQGTKKSKAELELQAQNREKAIQDALKADKDYYDNKAKLEDEAQKKELEKIQTTSDNIVAAKTVELNRIKILYGENSKAFKDLQNEILQIQLKAVKDQLALLENRAASGEKLTDEEYAQYDKLGIALGNLTNQVLETNKVQKGSAEELANAKKAILENELAQSGTTLERQEEIANQILTDELSRIDTKRTKIKDDLAAGIIDQTAYDTESAKLDLQSTQATQKNEDTKNKIKDTAFKQEMQRLQGYANALGALSDLAGKDTIAGKALGIAQATINTYIGASEAIKQKSTLPSPFDVISKVANVATIIATGLKTVREIVAVKVPTEQVPEVRIRKAMGGVLQGPTHQMGGIATPFGELEGGEYVINRASTMMFRPALDRINALGGGTVDYQAQGFAPQSATSERPIFRTYVVASEMSSQQELDRIIKDRSKI